MARLRIETAPEITVYDEAFVIKAAANATAPLMQLKDSSGANVGNISATGVLTVTSVVASNAGTGSTDLATRGYVDAISAGTNWHAAVIYATAAALPACTYANGTSGVGATLTGNAFGALTIDGESPLQTYSVLVKNQVDAKQNGIYTVTTTGGASAYFVLTRRTDADNSPAGEVKPGDAVYVIDGTDSVGNSYVITSTGTGAGGQIDIGVDNIDYSVFAGTAATQAGAGLTRTGYSINVISADSGRIQVNADSIDLATVNISATAGSNTTSFVDSVTTDSYGRVTGVRSSSVSFAGYAVSASPGLTGTPTAPTANAGTSTTQIATTEFVQARALIAESNAANSAANIFVQKASFDAKGDILVGTADNTLSKLTVGTNGYVLKANSSEATGVEWAAQASINALDDIADVTITSAASGDILKWSGTAWVNDSALLAAKAPLASPTFTGNVSGITKTMVGLGNVDNTADTAKPVSTAQQTALDLKSNIASPTFTGVPAAPTAAVATNTTQIATTAFVRAEVSALVGAAPETLDTLAEIATSLANNATLSTTLTDAIALRAPLASPTFTGTVTLPTGTVTSAMILDGTIADADISTTAAIAQSKIADTTINAQAASYTLVLADKNKLVEVGNASANTLTVPPNSSVAFPVGSTLTILQTGAGQCTLTAGAGVTVNGTPGLKLRTTWSSATLIKRATDTWVALGDLVA
jgi:hypothetical protein